MVKLLHCIAVRVSSFVEFEKFGAVLGRGIANK